MSIPISQLVTGVVNADIELPGTNPLDTSSSPNGTTFKYIISDILQYILSAQGFITYQSCVAATTTSLTATYNNGTSGVGATLTNSGAQAVLILDGVTLAANDRVLVKDQLSTFENGIYVVTNAGSASTNWVLTRATDYDQNSEIVYLGVVLINQGSTQAGIIYQESSQGPFVIGTSPITFQQLQIDASLLPSASPANKLLRSDGVLWVQSTNAALSVSDALTQLTELGVDNITINGNSIVSTNTNGDLILTPNGTGDLVLDSLNWPQTDGAAGQALTTDGAGQLGWSTVSTVTTPTTDNAIARFNGTGGALQNSDVTIADNAKAAFITNGGLPQVNYLEISSAPTGQSVNILSAGTDASVNLWLIPKGGAQVAISSSANPAPVFFTDGTHSTTFQFATNAGSQSIAFPDGGTGNGTVALTLGLPPTITDNAIPRYTGTNGYIQNSLVTIDNTGIMSGATQLNVDNLRLDGNTISSTDTNGDLILTPDGTGDLVLDGLNWPQADGTSGQALTTNGSSQLSWTTVGAAYTPSALTKVDDTNVTLTLGGTPATALLQAVSLTLGWTGQLAVSRGGTGISSVGANGTLAQSNGTTYSFTTATYPSTASSAGTILRANGTNWVASTSTFADTYSASSLLYSNGANTVTGLATANSATLVTNGSGVPSWTSSMTNGQVLIGSTGAAPVPATLTGSGGITITNAAGSITISGTGGGFSWTEVTGTTQAMAANNGYIASNVSQVVLTLPATAIIGDTVKVQGKGTGGWRVAQNSGQLIHFNSSTSTLGITGYIESTQRYNSVELVCITANNEWAVNSASGNLTVF